MWMIIARLTAWTFSSNWRMKTSSPRRWMMAPDRLCRRGLLLLFASVAFVSSAACGEESRQERLDYLAKLTDEQKIELQRKKERFDELSKDAQEKLRSLHVSITSDPKSKELEETVKRYN